MLGRDESKIGEVRHPELDYEGPALDSLAWVLFSHPTVQVVGRDGAAGELPGKGFP